MFYTFMKNFHMPTHVIDSCGVLQLGSAPRVFEVWRNQTSLDEIFMAWRLKEQLKQAIELGQIIS